MDEVTLAGAMLAVSHAARPVVEKGVELIDSLLGKPCKVAGNLLADRIYTWQWTNRVRAFGRAKEILDAEQIPRQVLPTGFLLPVLDAVGNVEASELHELWARLIASALKDERHQHPAFRETLRYMSGEDARFLQEHVVDAVGGAGNLKEDWEFQAPATEWPIVVRLDALGVVSAGPLYRAESLCVGSVTGFGMQFLQATHG